MSRDDKWLLAGLTLAAVLAGASYPFASEVPYRNFWLASILAAPVSVALIYGVRRSPSNTGLRRLAAGAGWASVVAAGFLAPIFVHRELLHRSARRVPVPPGATKFSESIGLDGENGSGFRMNFETPASFEEVEAFYRDRLIPAGWRVHFSEDFPAAAFASMPSVTRQRRCAFVRNGAAFVIDFTEFVRDGERRRHFYLRGGHGLVRGLLW